LIGLPGEILFCVLAPTKEKVLKRQAELRGQGLQDLDAQLRKASGFAFYNTSRYDFDKLLADAPHVAPNLRNYIAGFSPNMREVSEKFGFDNTISKVTEAGLPFQVLERFKNVDLHPDKIDNPTMGTIFEELIRKFNEDAGVQIHAPVEPQRRPQGRQGCNARRPQIDRGLSEHRWRRSPHRRIGRRLGCWHRADQLEYDDKFMRHLAQVVRNGLGDRAGTCIDPKMQVAQDKTVCVVSCQRSPEPVFLKWKDMEKDKEGDFFVRSGPGTTRLPPESAAKYIQTRFPAPAQNRQS
jgi:hypothetical protein